jgi:hypothetical protein
VEIVLLVKKTDGSLEGCENGLDGAAKGCCGDAIEGGMVVRLWASYQDEVVRSPSAAIGMVRLVEMLTIKAGSSPSGASRTPCNTLHPVCLSSPHLTTLYFTSIATDTMRF